MVEMASQVNQKEQPPPRPDRRPPSVHETPEYQRYLSLASSPDDSLIPATVSDLVEKNRQHNYVQIIQDLYQILKKLHSENKSLKQSVIDQEEIIGIEVRLILRENTLLRFHKFFLLESRNARSHIIFEITTRSTGKKIIQNMQCCQFWPFFENWYSWHH